MWIELHGKWQRETFTHPSQSPNADGGADSSHVSLDPSCSKEVFPLRNLPAARFQKGSAAAFGIERIFGVGENSFRIFFNALQVLEYFLDVS